ncbi:MAG: hypothetical protein JST01_18365 [Cyanobacteria bacterium SZAS TMP-1]|nr:hypothetical protein [Cyanobacteria bacterium SZAS TMP-1]
MDWFLILLFVCTALPALGQALSKAARVKAIREIELKRGSRLITLIHCQDQLSFLGLPMVHFINIEDSERIVRAIHLTPKTMPIDIVLHTPGGLVLAAQQVAKALTRHPSKVTVFVPHYAMSGGTLLALAADQIVMDRNAVLGPVDPQLGQYPAVSVLAVTADKKADDLNDSTLMMAAVSRKAIAQMQTLVTEILGDHVPAVKVQPGDVAGIAESLVSGKWSHDHPITVEDALALGLPVSTEMPREIYDLMALYPQGKQGKTRVEYFPLPYRPVKVGRDSEPAK